MKAQDLMVGDFVTLRDCQKDTSPTILKVWQINADNKAFVSIDGNDVLDEISINDEIVGIPITPEILEKNGFIDITPSIVRDGGMSYWYLYPDTSFVIGLMKDNFFARKGNFAIYAPRYVHELQRALKTLKIEKEIVL